MSLTTRCPACQTSFRVVPDQLRISEGWVRCGQCNEIFDGNANLQRELSALDVEGLRPMAALVATDVLTEVDFELHDLGPPASNPEPLSATLEEPAVLAESSELSPDLGASMAVDLSPDLLAAPPGNLELPHPASSTSPDAEAAIEPGVIEEVPDAVADAPPVTFLRKMPETSIWGKRWVRAGLGLAALCLVATLTVQVVVQERDRITSLVPQARPLIVKLCGPLNCVVSPLRQIESIVIESSSFAKTRGDAYHLALVVKNLALLHLAMPSFELTLTDSQDQPVLRRVLTPSDFGASASPIAAGSEWSAGLDVAVRANSSVERFTGYRIIAFYP